MSVKLDGIDLNSVVDSIEANNEAGLDNRSENEALIENPGDSGDVGGVSVDVARVLGESNGSLNVGGSVNDAFNGETGAVNGDESLALESEMKEKKLENEGGFIGNETEKCDGNLGLELKKVGNGEFKVMIGRESYHQNQEMGVNMHPLHVQDRKKAKLVIDLNASLLSHGDVISSNVNNGSLDSEGLIGSNLPVSVGLVESTDVRTEAKQNVNLDMLIKCEITNGSTETSNGKNVKYGALMPKVRCRENQAEKEGEYYVSDLVWGKVRSHPWWPGQIFEPSAASEKAKKYFRKDSYLIAYFGDQTFAWNEASKIKPFRMYFSEMERQSNVETFTDAVDDALNEVSRRIESGLACQCLPVEVLAKVNFQVVVNSGIQEQSSRMCGADSFSTADSFFPEKLVNFLLSLAEAPGAAVDRLEFLKARAHVSAFNRWKGYIQLPEFEEFDGIQENDAVPSGFLDDQALSGKAKLPTQSSCQKRKHTDDQCKQRKKHIMELVRESSSSIPDGEDKPEGTASRKFPHASSRQKHKVIDVISNESVGKRRKGILSRSAQNGISSLPRKHIHVGERIGRVAGKLGGSTSFPGSSRDRVAVEHGGNLINVSGSGVSTISNGKSLKGRLAFQEYPPTVEMLSKLVISARNPVEGYSSLSSVAGFFSDFRNSICMEYNNVQKKSPEKQNAERACQLGSTGALKFEGMEDSYWTDRIIESRLDEQVLFEPMTNAEKDTVVAEPESSDTMNLTTVDDQEMNAVVTAMDVENPPHIMGEQSSEYSPTALILNFTDLESVPSIANLNEIFNRYGPLIESETDVLSKSKRAKVVFKKRPDAETAFSSTGKFSIFGPSLVSYRLKYSPGPRRASTASKKRGRKKKSTLAEECATMRVGNGIF